MQIELTKIEVAILYELVDIKLVYYYEELAGYYELLGKEKDGEILENLLTKLEKALKTPTLSEKLKSVAEVKK